MGPMLLLFVLIFVGPSAALETEDAIITQADFSLPATQPFSVAWSYFRSPFLRMLTNRSPTDSDQNRSCLTYDLKPGTCRLVKDCYPYTRLHQYLESGDTWIIGSRGICDYFEQNGRKVNGVCCHNEENAQVQVRDGVGTVNPIFNPLTRIVGGKEASPGEFPYMAAIMNGGSLYCGGTLIDSTHVLSAAHCVSGMSPQSVSKLTVILGAVSLKDPGKTTKRVKSVTVHKQFDSSKMYNDVALLTLESPVTSVSPVGLCAATSGGEAVVTGWGKLYDGGSGSDVLKKVTLTIKSQEDCQKNFGSKAPGGIVDHYVCASAPGKDSCGGDSGGPLIAYGCQVGIVSWGIGCATDTYGVYTRVSSFTTWINKNKKLT